jgi:hypothetical protein
VTLNPVLVHQVFGGIVGVFASIMLLRETDVLRGPWTNYLPAAALVFGGVLLLFDPWLFHGGDFGAEGHQHTAQGSFAAIAGLIEAYRVRRKSEHAGLLLVIPLVLVALGAGFLWHTQHQTGDMLLQSVQHRLMGATLLLAALLKIAANFNRRHGHWARPGWILILIVFALELLLYVERVQQHSSH